MICTNWYLDINQKMYRKPMLQTRQLYLKELISKKKKQHVILYITKISSDDKARLCCMG